MVISPYTTRCIIRHPFSSPTPDLVYLPRLPLLVWWSIDDHTGLKITSQIESDTQRKEKREDLDDIVTLYNLDKALKIEKKPKNRRSRETLPLRPMKAHKDKEEVKFLLHLL